jgi:CheY-like chemotaxis protein
MAPALMEDASQAQVETVLLVEDEISVLNLGRRLLEQLGYVVICSNHPEEALQKMT